MTALKAKTASGIATNDQEEKIQIRERVAYGLGDFGSNMAWNMVSNFLLFFYTDVFGLGAAIVGTLFLVQRIWDGINDPLIGWLTDRTRSRFGSYRPYLLFFAVPFGVTLALMFATPSLDFTGKVIWAYVTYFAMEALYTLVNVPYGAMIPSITQSQQERANLSSARFIGAMVATLIVSGATPALLSAFPTEQIAFQVVAIIFAVIAILSLWLCFSYTRERHTNDVAELLSIRGAVGALKSNTPMIIVIVALLLQFTGFTVRNTSILHYFKYIVGQEALAGVYFALMALFGIGGAVIAPIMIKRFDKRATAMVGLSIFCLAGLFWFIAGNSITVIAVSAATSGFGMMMTAVTFMAMLADVVEYGLWKSGSRAAGTINAISVMATKIATAVGGALVGYLLAFADYSANVTQTQGTLAMIQGMVTYMPAVAGVSAIVITAFYGLDRKKFSEILADLKERKLQ